MKQKIQAKIKELKTKLNKMDLKTPLSNIARGVIVGVPVLAAALLIYITVLNNQPRIMPNNITVPDNVETFRDSSVMIINSLKSSGGSGVILDSTPGYSEILTNRHVCKVVENGGYVVKNGELKQVAETKRYEKHDLCLIKVYYDYGINIPIAKLSPKLANIGHTSGHPALRPHTVSSGHFSDIQIIEVVTDMKECKKEDLQGPNGLYCFFFGAMPVFEEFEAQALSALIMPGSSGSAVYNKTGELSGLVFAGSGRDLSYAYIVPHAFVVDFIQNKDKQPYLLPIKKEDKSSTEKAVDAKNRCKDLNSERSQVSSLCEKAQTYLLWRNQ